MDLKLFKINWGEFVIKSCICSQYLNDTKVSTNHARHRAYICQKMLQLVNDKP